jgi:hypothetical protein
MTVFPFCSQTFVVHWIFGPGSFSGINDPSSEIIISVGCRGFALCFRFGGSVGAFQPTGQRSLAPSDTRDALFGKHDEKRDDSHNVQWSSLHDIFLSFPLGD